jgi:hypothetical protein
MNFVEYPIGADGNAPTRVGTLRCFRSCLLSDIIEGIWDCDIPDGEFAKALTIKCAPGTSLLLMGQYRTPAEMRQGTWLLPTKCATQIQSHAVTLRPTGALGVVIVCLRSDAASRIVGAPLREFANATIHLGNLFRAREVAMCDDMLAGRARAKSELLVSNPSCFDIFVRITIASRAAPRCNSGKTRQCRYTPSPQNWALAHVI